MPGAQVEPVLGWSFTAGGKLTAAPAVVEGAVLFGTPRGAVYSVDSREGLERWTYQAVGAVSSAPEVRGDTAYFATERGNVYALDRVTGRVAWQKSVGEPVRAPLAAGPKGLYVGTQSGGLYALGRGDGRVLWSVRFNKPVLSRPGVGGNTVYAADTDGDLVAVNTADGKIRWRIPSLASSPFAGPSILGQTVYVGGVGGRVTALDAANGKQRWQASAGTGPVTTLALISNVAVAVAADGARTRVSALESATGKQIWQTLVPARVTSSPAVVDGVVYLGAENGTVYSLDLHTGKDRWAFRLKGKLSSPVVALGRAYVASDDGSLYAVGTPQAQRAPVPPVEDGQLRADAAGDTRAKEQVSLDIVRAGAQFASYGDIPGVVFEAQLALPPPPATTKQVAYVWALDYTLDSKIDYYVFVYLEKGKQAYQATLERNDDGKLVTINDRLPLAIRGSSIHVFLPQSPHLSTSDAQPTLEWYMYSYLEKLPAQDEITDNGQYFILQP